MDNDLNTITQGGFLRPPPKRRPTTRNESDEEVQIPQTSAVEPVDNDQTDNVEPTLVSVEPPPEYSDPSIAPEQTEVCPPTLPPVPPPPPIPPVPPPPIPVPPPPVPPRPCCPPTKTLVLNNTIIKSVDDALTITEGYIHNHPAYFIELNDELVIPNIIGEPPIVVEKHQGTGGDPTRLVISINTMTGASSITDGLSGTVPAPLAGQEDYYLSGDGSWHKLVVENGNEYIDVQTHKDAGNNDVITVSGTQVEATADNIDDWVDGEPVAHDKLIYVGEIGIKQLWLRVRESVSDEIDDKIETAVNSLDSVATSVNGTNLQITVTETDGKITNVSVTDNTASRDHVHGNISNDGKIGNAADLSVVTGTAGELTTADLTTVSPFTQGTGTEFISSVSQDSRGKITATKSAITPASISTPGIVQLSNAIDSTSETMAATPKAVKDALSAASTEIGDSISELNAVETSVDGTNVQVTVTETAGKITDVSISTDNTASRDHVHGNITTDGKIGQSPDLSVVTGNNGEIITSDLTTASPVSTGTALDFITSVSQDSKGKITATKAALPAATTTSPGIVQIADQIDMDPSHPPSHDEAASAYAVAVTVQSVKNTINNVVHGMTVSNKLSDGKYITELSQRDGKLDYSVADMARTPEDGSLKPITSGGLYNEKIAREHFDAWIEERVPIAASGQNQLADKAYVDALGERIESRYLAYSIDNLPFPSYAIFDQARANDEFWYDGEQVSPNNNDVIVITSDESKIDMSTTGNPPTTRYRYIAHKVQAMDNDVPVVDIHGDPVWVVDDKGNPIWSGEWFFEYVINNSALNQDQLLAINSGITASKVGNYDAHLTDYDNPHHTTYEQVATASDIETTAQEIGILHGAVITTDELNSLDGINTNKTVQEQLNEKADRVLPANLDDPNYHPQGNIVIVGDIADVHGRYNIEDSGAAITQYYDGTDTVNPATGSAIKQAIDNLDAEVTSDTGTNVNVTVVQENGVVTGVIMSDNSASASQGALADSAIQKVKVTDIQNGTRVTRELPKSTSDGNAVTIDLTDYKHLQTAVSDPTASGTTLDFISNVSQNAEGVITASKKSVTVDSNYYPQSGNPASGAAIADALNGLHNEVTGEGSLVNVTVATNAGNVSAVTVDDSGIETATGAAISQAISALNVENSLTPGKYISSLSEINGKIAVVTDSMDAVPTAGSQKPVTSGGVKTALQSLDYADTAVPHQFVTKVDETDGIISVTRAQPTIADVDGLVSTLGTKVDKVDGATVGNLATFDATGNIADTGLNVSTFATAAQGDKADTAVQSVKMVDSNGVELNNATSVIIPLAAPTGSGETPGLMSAADKAKLDGLDGNLNDKADKVANATAGNLASLDETGNLADSGIDLESVITGVFLEKDDDGSKTSESLVSGHVATIRETTDEEIRRILAVLP